MEITANKGTIQEKIQRVLYNQPRDKVFDADRELLELEFYLREGSGNRYNLVRGIARRYASIPSPLLIYCSASASVW